MAMAVMDEAARRGVSVRAAADLILLRRRRSVRRSRSMRSVTVSAPPTRRSSAPNWRRGVRMSAEHSAKSQYDFIVGGSRSSGSVIARAASPRSRRSTFCCWRRADSMMRQKSTIR